MQQLNNAAEQCSHSTIQPYTHSAICYLLFVICYPAPGNNQLPCTFRIQSRNRLIFFPLSNKVTRILIKTGKIVGYVLLGIIGLFAVVWLLIQQPRIQTAITQKVTQNLSEKLGTTFRIEGVDIDFFKTIVLEGIYVEDQRKDTLLYAKKLRVNIGVLSLAGKTITANLIGLEGARVNIYKARGDTTFNYEFIPAAFASTDTTRQDTTSAGWGFDLLEVNLNDIRLSFRDEVEGSDLRMALRELDLDLETLGLEEQYPKINKLTIDGLRTAFAQSQAESDTLVAAAETAKLDIPLPIPRRAVADSLDQPYNQPEDSVETPFNDSGWRLALSQLNIRNTDIRYDVGNGKPVEQGMDFEHLNVQNLLEISDAVDDNDFALNVNNFAFKERSGFVLEQLAMEFEADLPRATLRLEEFRTPNSARRWHYHPHSLYCANRSAGAAAGADCAFPGRSSFCQRCCLPHYCPGSLPWVAKPQPIPRRRNERTGRHRPHGQPDG